MSDSYELLQHMHYEELGKFLKEHSKFKSYFSRLRDGFPLTIAAAATGIGSFLLFRRK